MVFERLMTTVRQLLPVVFFAAYAFAASYALAAESDRESPNFVIFYVDDLGWADTSVQMMDGEPESRSGFHLTPALEQLANHGMRFSNGYAPTPTCTGSRISIQFGQTSARLQFRNVFDVLAKKQRPSGWDDEISMASVLKAAGKNYVTAHFGKGMGVRRMDDAGYDVTDEFDKGPNGNGHGSYIDVKQKTPIPDDNPKRIVDLTRRSVEFIQEHAGNRPFFLMLSHYAVHIPHQASPAAIARARARWIAAGNPEIDSDHPDYARYMAKWRYAAMVEETDASLGAILKTLRATGQFDNTYVIFTSDNGGDFGRRDAMGVQFNGPLRHGKRSTFEGGLRVPFVVSGPGVRQGSQCDVPVVQWDVLPTLHDLAGSTASLPSEVDGGSLRSVLFEGNRGSVSRETPGLVFHYTCHYHPPVSVLRKGDYKLMRHLNSGETKLFNVAVDYREEHDLAEREPLRAKQMLAELDQYIEQVDGGRMSDVYAAYFEWLDEQLRTREQRYRKGLEVLRRKDPADAAARTEELEEEWTEAKLDHAAKTAKCKRQMQSHLWRDFVRKGPQ